MADANMAAARAVGRAAGQAAGQQQQQGGGWSGMLQMASRMLMMWYFINWFTGGNKPAAPKEPPPPVLDDAGRVVPVAKAANYYPVWPEFDRKTDLYVYLAEEPYFNSFSDVSKLIWKEDNIVYGNLSEIRSKELTLDVPTIVQNNGSWYAHIFLTYNGQSPNPRAISYVPDQTLYYRKSETIKAVIIEYSLILVLTRYRKKKKVVIKKKLVAGDKDKKEEQVSPESDSEDDEANNENAEAPWLSYWWTNLTVSLVAEKNVIPSNTLPAIMQTMRIHEDGVRYYPVFYADDFWLLSDHLNPINETTKQLNLTLSFHEKSWWYYQTVTQMEESFRLQTSMMGVEERETEEVKRMFLETNPILLTITMCVSILHSIFDFLAFKNDIAFWKDKKDMDGMSFRTIVMNVGFQLIIFLYLLDNETSWMIIISNGVGLLIEAWKIQKTVDIKTKVSFPFVEFIDKYKPSKLAKKTMKYDKIAFKYLSYVLYPLLAGYALYSVMYEEHKSWYSYIIGTLVGFVYMFGFISMTPQLFINYKLKSVAHMPWKTFMYKALNTFIDDLFAFVIKMPWMHRIACLRDDVIFLVYLYQRWIYPEDKRRRNEFGQVGEGGGQDDDEFLDSDDEREAAEKKKDGAKEWSEDTTTDKKEEASDEKEKRKCAEEASKKLEETSADAEGLRKRK